MIHDIVSTEHEADVESGPVHSGMILRAKKKRRSSACDVITMSAKTPVSILQEMMVKKGTVPNYDLIYDGGGTHINTFTYRVTCDGLMATGTGRCKKDAKHTAAKNMLQTIATARSYPQLPATPDDSPVRTPLPEQLPSSPKISANEPFLNAIGELKDLCAENELQEPQYDMISDVGPPHARIFTYRCVVSTFREEGKAMTKQQAKHEASRKMLERLTDIVSDLRNKDSVYAGVKRRSDALDSSASDALPKSLYPELTKLPDRRINLGIKLREYHTKLKNSFNDDTVPTKNEVLAGLESLVERYCDTCHEPCEELLLRVKAEFQQFADLLNMETCTVVHDIKNNDKNKMLLVKLNSVPDIAEIEIGDDLVAMELRAIAKVLKTFQLFVQ